MHRHAAPAPSSWCLSAYFFRPLPLLGRSPPAVRLRQSPARGYCFPVSVIISEQDRREQWHDRKATQETQRARNGQDEKTIFNLSESMVCVRSNDDDEFDGHSQRKWHDDKSWHATADGTKEPKRAHTHHFHRRWSTSANARQFSSTQYSNLIVRADFINKKNGRKTFFNWHLINSSLRFNACNGKSNWIERTMRHQCAKCVSVSLSIAPAAARTNWHAHKYFTLCDQLNAGCDRTVSCQRCRRLIGTSRALRMLYFNGRRGTESTNTSTAKQLKQKKEEEISNSRPLFALNLIQFRVQKFRWLFKWASIDFASSFSSCSIRVHFGPSQQSACHFRYSRRTPARNWVIEQYKRNTHTQKNFDEWKSQDKRAERNKITLTRAEKFSKKMGTTFIIAPFVDGKWCKCERFCVFFFLLVGRARFYVAAAAGVKAHKFKMDRVDVESTVLRNRKCDFDGTKRTNGTHTKNVGEDTILVYRKSNANRKYE